MTQVTLLVTPVDVTASLVFPTITAGANRKALLMISGVGGGTPTIPTTLTIGGVTPTHEAGLGLGVGNSRAATGLFSLNETQIAAMSGSAIVYSGGSLGEPRLIALAIQDTEQIATLDKSFYSSGGATATSGATGAFDRIADSWTFFGFHCNALGTATMSNPSTSANFSSANSRSTIGYAADTARTIASSFTIGSVRIYAFSTNFRPVPSQSITSINGGNGITAGKSGVTSVSTGFTGVPTTITTNASGVTCSNIGGSTNAATFDISDRVDGGLYPKSGTSVNFTFTNGGESAVGTQTIVKKATETVVIIASPLFTANTLANAILDQTGRTIVDGDEFYHTTYSDLVITADTDFTVTDAGSFDLWLYVSAGADAGKMFYYGVTITEGGAVVVTPSNFLGSTIKGRILTGSLLTGKLL